MIPLSERRLASVLRKEHEGEIDGIVSCSRSGSKVERSKFALLQNENIFSGYFMMSWFVSETTFLKHHPTTRFIHSHQNLHPNSAHSPQQNLLKLTPKPINSSSIAFFI